MIESAKAPHQYSSCGGFCKKSGCERENATTTSCDQNIETLMAANRDLQRRIKAYQQAWDAKDLHTQLGKLDFHQAHGVDFEKAFADLTAQRDELQAKLTALENQDPVAWSVTVGNDYKNCIEITHCESDAVAQYEASTEGGFESLYTLHKLYAAAGAACATAIDTPEVHDALCPALSGGKCICSESPATVDKAWSRFCGGIGRGHDAPLPGMIESFEVHYGQSFTDKDWRNETGIWAAAWGYAIRQKGARPSFDLITHLRRQIAFSQQTFGPGARTAGVIKHIRKELIEIEAAPSDLTEWVDLILLALDGAWRAGHTAEAICQGIDAKQTTNEGRDWPDWRTVDPNEAIEHVRSAPSAPGLAMESGEFVPASEISYHPV